MLQLASNYIMLRKVNKVMKLREIATLIFAIAGTLALSEIVNNDGVWENNASNKDVNEFYVDYEHLDKAIKACSTLAKPCRIYTVADAAMDTNIKVLNDILKPAAQEIIRIQTVNKN